MREFIPSSGPTDKVYLFIGAIAGGLLTLAIVQAFSPTPITVISAIAISLLSFSSTPITRPTLWWTGTGAILGRKFPKMHVITIKEFLLWASAFTAGLFAIVVTTSFAPEGLEVARAFSSRLSATTTILVTALVIIGYLLFELETSNPFTQHNP